MTDDDKKKLEDEIETHRKRGALSRWLMREESITQTKEQLAFWFENAENKENPHESFGLGAADELKHLQKPLAWLVEYCKTRVDSLEKQVGGKPAKKKWRDL